jgi:hypothetical protein
MSSRVTIGRRFAGPPGSANGGYTCGVLATAVGGAAVAITVTLRRPPPLDTPMDMRPAAAGGVSLHDGDALITEAGLARDAVLDLVDPVGYADAAALGPTYAGLTSHPFPGCFVCGVALPAGDGMGLRPGRLPDQPDTTTSAWRPQSSLPHAGGKIKPEIVWAALDCPGGWTIDQIGRPAVLGRLTAVIDDQPQVGEPCVVMGRLLRQDGRKSITATTLYDGDGRVLGRAEAVWIEVSAPRS